MDMPMVPAWLDAALAYATVAIAAMTALARILDRVVPQLQAIEARSGASGGASSFVARMGGALTRALVFAQRYIPQVTIGSAPATRVIVPPPERTTRERVPVVSDVPADEDDPDDDGGPGAAGAALGPSAPERRSHTEPHGPFANG